jgi:DNA-binding LacI/PurR family transcriptional regulator
LIQDIQRVADEVEGTPSQSQYSEYGEVSHSTLTRRFEGYSEAMQAAGLEPNRISYTDDELIDDLQRVADIVGKSPTNDEYDTHGVVHSSTLADRFGGYSEAKEAAGLEPTQNGGEQFTNEELIQDIQRVAEIVNKSPTNDEYNTHGKAHSSTLAGRFGGYSAAIEAAGLDPNWRSYTDDELIADIQRVADEVGGRPTQTQYNQKGKSCADTLESHFETFSEAVEAAGFEPPSPGASQQYTDDELIQDIQRVADKIGSAPSICEYNTHGKASGSTLATRFEGYNKAIKAAGLDPIPVGGKQFTNSELIQDIQRVADIVGKSPTNDEYNTYGVVHSSTLADRFGGYSEAKEAAGLEPNWRSYTEDELIEDFQRVAYELRSTPTRKQYNQEGMACAATLVNRFDSYDKVAEAAGFEPPHHEVSQQYTDKELIQDIQRVADEVGSTPSQPQYNEYGKASYSTLADRFGSYSAAVEAAGLKPNRIPRTDDELIDDLQRVAEITGEPLTKQAYNDHGVVHPNTIQRRFDSWVDAVESAGIEANESRQYYSTGELIESIQQVANELGRPPGSSEFTEHGISHQETLKHRFGTYTDAIRAAGFEPHWVRKKSPDTILEDIQTVTQQLGSPPSRLQYVKYGNHGIKTIRRHFDLFNNAIRAAGYEPNHERNISDWQLLADIRQTLGRTGTAEDVRLDCKYSMKPMQRSFDTVWRALVRSGVRPRSSVPLSHLDYKLFVQALDEFSPIIQLYGELVAFTGIGNVHIENFDMDWVKHLDSDRRDTLIIIPSDYLITDQEWVITVPEKWTDPITGDTQPTSLNDLLKHYQAIGFDYEERAHGTVRYYIHDVCREAGIARNVVRNDLRATAVTHLAERGIPTWKIRHQIGDQQTGWNRSINDYYLFLYQFRGYTHPDYEPAGVYLDPFSGDMREIKSEAD